MKSVDLAKSEWARLQQQFPDALGPLKLTVQRADLGAKGMYYPRPGRPSGRRAKGEEGVRRAELQKQQCLPVRL